MVLTRVHGRMPSVTTGANMANKDLTYISVSGDGDTASIGMGQFAHVVRRNLNMVYIVMNNGMLRFNQRPKIRRLLMLARLVKKESLINLSL